VDRAVSNRQPWIRAALLVGLVYFLVGRVFAVPGEHVQAWRLAAWLVSAVAYATHIGYEHFRLRSSTRSTALHVALAVAIGGFTLALAGMIHAASTPAGIRPVWFLALLLWPVFTAVPAFLGVLALAAVLPRPRALD